MIHHITSFEELLQAFASIPQSRAVVAGDTISIDENIEIPSDGTWTAPTIVGTADARVTIEGNGKKIGSKSNPIAKLFLDQLRYTDVKDLNVYANGTMLAGLVSNAYHCTFKNVTVNGSIKGWAGFAALSTNSQFEDCTNNADITSTEYAGGIVSESREDKFVRCRNTGNLIGTKVGGISAFVNESSVISCINCGSVSSVGAGGGVTYLGGIIGIHIVASPDVFVLVADNVNSGTIGDKKGSVADAGGIVGNANGGIMCRYVANVNAGSVANAAGSYVVANAGGIIGKCSGVAIVEKNIDLGDVFSPGSAGGLIGASVLDTDTDLTVISNYVCASRIESTAEKGDGCGGIIGRFRIDDSTATALFTDNYVNVKLLLSGNANIHQIIGKDETAVPDGKYFGDNYYTASGVLSPAPDCATRRELCGKEYDPDNDEPATGDTFSACMLGVWNAPAGCGNGGGLGGTQNSLVKIIGSVASIENGMKDILEGGTCLMNRALAGADNVDDLALINEKLVNMISMATDMEVKLKDKLTMATDLIGQIIDKCGCVIASGCCVPLYFAASNSNAPSPGIQLVVVSDSGETLDGSRLITDGEGKVYLSVSPGTSYEVTMESGGEYEDEVFTVTVDDDCSATIDGVDHECCPHSCSIETNRPGFGKGSCKKFKPFAPSCKTADACAVCKF